MSGPGKGGQEGAWVRQAVGAAGGWEEEIMSLTRETGRPEAGHARLVGSRLDDTYLTGPRM